MEGVSDPDDMALRYPPPPPPGVGVAE
jgi:hypothetical protein